MATKSLDGVLTKKAHQREKYDETGIEELKKCIDPDTGYLYLDEFIKNIDQ
tara:strand:+ start:393 stop:545 length:153 start_codon:yes stop_codon:yes gene_type:complete